MKTKLHLALPRLFPKYAYSEPNGDYMRVGYRPVREQVRLNVERVVLWPIREYVGTIAYNALERNEWFVDRDDDSWGEGYTSGYRDGMARALRVDEYKEIG